ncbi:sn-glycerol-3-phosphate ABC transporter ATP-binding protein UgpC [Hahella sp. KA22]|uniref:ABC transporter ATP-binding protein n=1 Tax=Hahella sp. KA22 TaxID=1628392 RepID=UPI000FDE38BD|nr:sn-glycerol-3-phosphate ABC transporter ATP-binding protein UgpC [Hahella sp. KA22]AZZ92430.1 sn-glycerol-3-phosphate ABC transporter ATP-binding protein UgpC [Hahella sp. KA22]QAY55804.1 sn-glycerol-3-phosphate ABC transporter ATP-binding protein UgpC [Hahella sp. KA22]
MASVTLQNLGKQYKKQTVLRDIHLQVRDGEFLVLVGPSGCGKSTLLRMIAGLETVSGGDIRIGERLVNQLDPVDRGIAMVFQSYALYPHMTVWDNMAFGLKMAGVAKPERERRIQQAVELLQLQPLVQRKPAELSGGQRQRVAIGRAIVRKPEVFLFDEPLSNLDAKLRDQMRVQLSELHQRLGATMIYVTHDQKEAMTMADRIVVMRNGVIEQVGTPLELYHQPANRFVAGFIGSPAMNFLPVRMRALTARDVSLELPWGQAIQVDASRFNLNAGGAGLKAGVQLELGIRAQGLVIDDSSDLRMQVDVVEELGNIAYVHGRIQTHRLIMETTTRAPRAGTEVGVRLKPDMLHLFDEHAMSLASQMERAHAA